jgi:XTP/dITP diphosphohydrolase
VIERLVVASKNTDKIAEVEEVLAGLGLVREIVRGLDWPDVEETEPTLVGNALLKARAVLTATGLTAVADDTGLEVDALGGDPGVHTARYAGPDATYADNVTKLLAEMEGVKRRTARFKTAIALVDEHGREVTVEGVVEGEITTERRGAGGFGYDPVFSVGGRTFAEMASEEKHLISHRALALRALAAALGADRDRS